MLIAKLLGRPVPFARRNGRDIRCDGGNNGRLEVNENAKAETTG